MQDFLSVDGRKNISLYFPPKTYIMHLIGTDAYNEKNCQIEALFKIQCIFATRLTTHSYEHGI